MPRLSVLNGMYLVWMIRADLRDAFDLTTEIGAIAYWQWWLTHGRKEYPYVSFCLNEALRTFLSEPTDKVVQDTPVPIPLMLYLLWSSREDMRRTFDLDTREGREGLAHWWSEHGFQDQSELTVCVKSPESLPPTLIPQVQQHEFQNAPIAVPTGLGEYHEGGLNLVGFARGELGIGEDLRMAVATARCHRIPFTVYNAPISMQSRENDPRLAGMESAEAIYRTNLIILPGMETVRILVERGTGLFAHRYTIGAWQWELPSWPPILRDAYRLVQEIWAPSRYIAEAFRESAPVEVLHMPMAVEVYPEPHMDRSDFGLPPNTYIFLFVFDSLSHFARKNPLAVVSAFQRAFPIKNREVGLVIKCMNASRDHAGWRTVVESCVNDSRIITINETFDRERILGLLNCCDAFVSLHRAEGFGRAIAEAMLLGKPVVVTNFSGNTDFTNSETAFLVDGPLIPLKKTDYHFGEGQYWCDPDVEQAAHQMLVCLEDSKLASLKAKAGQELIRRKFSPASVGSMWIDRLRELGILTNYVA
ncbi:MAG: glycosyltransferase family 4 protein [Desulfomonilaceae bacterium]